MAKPILVVRIPSKFDLTEHHIDTIRKVLETSCPDYNQIIGLGGDERVEFEVLNVQDYPQIDFDTLKQKLENEFFKA